MGVVTNDKLSGTRCKRVPAWDFSNVPWNEMYLLRNKVSHEYFGIDYEIIWDLASNYLPENKLQIEEILGKEQ